MATATHTYVELELSQATYDEIERKLLEAGYDHLFVQGPGSAIDMHGIAVTREVPSPAQVAVNRFEAAMKRRPVVARTLAQLEEEERRIARMRADTVENGGRYCFACDQMVTEPCKRADCLEALNREAEVARNTESTEV